MFVIVRDSLNRAVYFHPASGGWVRRITPECLYASEYVARCVCSFVGGLWVTTADVAVSAGRTTNRQGADFPWTSKSSRPASP